MTPREAWEYAAQWGSYMRAGDPGACMYGFNESFVVQSEEHRAKCLAWIDNDCLPAVRDRPEDYDAGELDRLGALRAMIAEAPLG